MPSTTSNACSVSRLRSSCNPHNVRTRTRCASRLAAITDKRLPMGARTLYTLLDDYAGMKGVCWPKQATLAHRLGASRQSIQRWVADLARTGWLAIERTGRAHRYTLKWAMASGCEAGGHRHSLMQPDIMSQDEVAAEPVTGDSGAEILTEPLKFHHRSRQTSSWEDRTDRRRREALAGMALIGKLLAGGQPRERT